MCIHIQGIGRRPGGKINRLSGWKGGPGKGARRQAKMKKINVVRDLKREVYNSLRQGIKDGSLAPGTWLKETELVEELNVSRTPIREALNQLAQDGLIDIFPRKGAFVKDLTIDEVLEILLIREVLEGMAARMAAVRMTDAEIDDLESHFQDYRAGKVEYVVADRRFHDAIIQASGAMKLQELTANLYDRLQMSRILSWGLGTPEAIETSITEHLLVVDALRQRQPELAEEVMRDNFQRTRERVSAIG